DSLRLVVVPGTFHEILDLCRRFVESVSSALLIGERSRDLFCDDLIDPGPLRKEGYRLTSFVCHFDEITFCRWVHLLDLCIFPSARPLGCCAQKSCAFCIRRALTPRDEFEGWLRVVRFRRDRRYDASDQWVRDAVVSRRSRALELADNLRFFAGH